MEYKKNLFSFKLHLNVNRFSVYFVLLVFIITFLLGLFSLFSFSAYAACWQHPTLATCTADTEFNCNWKNDSWGSWCEERNCWSLYDSTSCENTAIPNKNCTWKGGGVSYYCEKLNCWSYSGTNASTCSNNPSGLNCQWSNNCYTQNWVSGINCYSFTNQTSCLNASGCVWGQCSEVGCWNYNDISSCRAGKDSWSGKNCTWDTSYGNGYCTNNGCWKTTNESACQNSNLNGGLNCEWKYNSCQDVGCWSYSSTNASACLNNSLNLSCSWDGSWCSTVDCWSYTGQSACQNKTGCNWKPYYSSGWCQEVQCWNWDSYSGGSQSSCLGNSTKYGLSCIWKNTSNSDINLGGSCYKDVSSLSCTNITSEKKCMDTFYCWWQYNDWNNVGAGGNCSNPSWGSGSYSNTSNMANDWNPGCYIFDTNLTDCNNILGCNHTGNQCDVVSAHTNYNEITNNGINCTMINSSNLCNTISALTSCCSWQNSSCTTNKLTTSCWDQMEQKTEDSCDDAETQVRCDQIAGNPWYMPCAWNNLTSKCVLKIADIFGNGSTSLMKIENKENCKAANGKWIIENYCEGNISVPVGRCEYKFDEEDNCNKACFACENKDSDGNTVNATNAVTACTNSKLGFCGFSASTNAPNGIGFCKANEQFKKGVVGNCDTNCGDCTFKGNKNNNDTTKKPNYYCSNSKSNSEGGGCKWITDNSTVTGGYCLNKGEKTCEDSCDRCKTQDNCANIGRTALANKTGSCKWQGDLNTGSCVANVAGDVEICWDGIDNDNDDLIDCADSGCYSDTFCGFVEGDCFSWTNNNSCIAANCEWITDNWGSWCDFKGGQCWKYNVNESTCAGQTNCQWNNGTGNIQGWCEKDWSQNEVCMALNKSVCYAMTGSGCSWVNDTWCDSSGVTTDWCANTGGWCNSEDFAPKNCWLYNSRTGCTNHTSCNWQTDQWSKPMCEVNWSGNCWQYTSNDSCTTANCNWRNETFGSYNSVWCDNSMSSCWSSLTQATCNAVTKNGVSTCYWENNSWGGYCQPLCFNGSYNNNENLCSSVPGCNWKAEAGWCQETGCWDYSNTSQLCTSHAADGCRWKSPGWCDPKGGGFSSAAGDSGGGIGSAMGADCYKYDGNQTLCTNKTIINISCGWSVSINPTCDINWGTNCWQYSSVAAGCNAENGCWFKNDSWGASCMNVMDQCWNNASYQSWSNENWLSNCTSNYLCTNNSWGGCEPKCLTFNSTICTNTTYFGKCKWVSGWCNPSGMNDMFDNMETGASAPLGRDGCGETGMQASVDICGFGLKDMGDSYGFGAGVNNFENSSVCNKEKLSSFVMGQVGSGAGSMPGQSIQTGGSSFGAEKTGAGNDTVTYLVYLDTDGSTMGGCALSHNSSAVGYEFRFKYSSVWNANTSKAIETYNSDKCDDSSWKATDIKISAWKKKMCGDIGGPMIAIKKADLAKYPALYDSTQDMRVAVATIGNIGNISTPTDSAGPGWTTPGSIDFEIKGAFDYGADSVKFEDILKKGFLQGEDCFNSIDDDSDGSIDCNDWDCQYSSKCTNTGINAAGYADTSSPLVTGIKIEEYPDAALVMYDTNKPTNGTLEFYGNDSQCLSLNKSIFDVGILSTNVRDYKTWHTGEIYNDGGINSIAYNLANNTAYYYKLKACDSSGKCAMSKCSTFITPLSQQKCAYCNFVTRIKTASDWAVSYDSDRNGVYEHVQGYVCGPNAGMKSNYTLGRKANIKLYKTDNSTYIEFLNVSLTKTGLNDKVRTISSSGDMIHSTSGNYVGLSAETRDKIINNLHPEICRIKIPVAAGATCNTLYHCDDSGNNCVDRTVAAGGAPIDATNCVWNVPNCEFSTYKTSSAPGGSSSSSIGGSSFTSSATQCGDSKDNDGDGKIDYPDDLGCVDKNDANETDIICNMKWDCSEWSSCTNGQQSRTCTESNNCEIKKSQRTVAVIASETKPIITKKCEIKTTTSESDKTEGANEENILQKKGRSIKNIINEFASSTVNTFFVENKIIAWIVLILLVVGGIIVFFIERKKISENRKK